MTVGVYGKHLYGEVDKVPGLCHVATLFWHMNYVPLFPLRSYVVCEGTQKDEQFQGIAIPLNLKSVLAGYLRGWLAAVAMFSAGVASLALTSFYLGRDHGAIFVAFGTAGAAVAVLWFIFTTRTRWFLAAQLALLLASAFVCHDVITRKPNAVPVPQAALGGPQVVADVILIVVANTAALLHSMARRLTPVSERRGIELGNLLGIPAAQIRNCLGVNSFGQSDWSEEVKQGTMRINDG